MLIDDVEINTKSVSDLQLALNTLEKCYYKSSSEVNVNKTKVMFILMKVLTVWYLGQFQIFGFRLHNSGYFTTGIDM